MLYSFKPCFSEQAKVIGVDSCDSEDSSSDDSEFDADTLLAMGVPPDDARKDLKDDVLEGLTYAGESVRLFLYLFLNVTVTYRNDNMSITLILFHFLHKVS